MEMSLGSVSSCEACLEIGFTLGVPKLETPN